MLIFKFKKSHRKAITEDDSEWKLALKYCKDEYKACSGCIVFSALGCLIAFTANFFIEVNEYRLPLNFYIISMEDDSLQLKWLFNTILLLGVGVSFSTSFTVFFPFSLTLMNQVCFRTDIAILSVKNLGGVLDDFDANGTLKDASSQLKNIVEMIGKAQHWRKNVHDLLKFYFLLVFTNISIIMCLCIFTLTENVFGSSSMLTGTFLFLGQLFAFCWLGTRVTTRYAELTAALYDVKWHLMEVKQQKELQLIMVMAQNLKGFDGIFSPVNMQTFQQVQLFPF